MHSPIFEKAKDYYGQGLWGKNHLKALVGKGKLMESEYEEITGEVF